MVAGPERSSAAAPMSRREALRLGLGSAVASVAGCLDAIRGAGPDHDWPTFARDAANTGATSARGPDEPAELWTAEIGPVYGTPTVVDDTVYAIGHDEDGGGSTLYALAAESGDERWSVRAAQLGPGPPTVVDGTAFVVGQWDGEWQVVAVEDGGGERWSTEMASYVLRSVTVVDGTAYVHSGEGVHALDAETGDEVWSTDVTGRFGYAPAVVGDTVYVSSQKSASALDAASGDERWTFTGEDPDRGSLTSVGSVVGDGIVYFGTTREERIVAVDADTGEKRWTAGHDWLTQPPAIAHETLYAGIEPGAVHTDISEHTGSRIVGIDAATGEDRWTFDRYGTEEFGLTPAVGDDVVYARTLGGLYAIDAHSGELRWEFDGPFGLPWGEDGSMARPPAQSEQIVSAPAIVDGTVFVGSPAGGVYAVGEA